MRTAALLLPDVQRLRIDVGDWHVGTNRPYPEVRALANLKRSSNLVGVRASKDAPVNLRRLRWPVQ